MVRRSADAIDGVSVYLVRLLSGSVGRREIVSRVQLLLQTAQLKRPNTPKQQLIFVPVEIGDREVTNTRRGG